MSQQGSKAARHQGTQAPEPSVPRSLDPSMPRSRPRPSRRPGWSDRQRNLFLRACSAAGLNDRQRYVLMRHVGCPNLAPQASGLKPQAPRPSIKHPRNTNPMFVQAMAIAEAQAAMRGRDVPGPREHASWRDAAASGRSQLVNKARCIINEARQRAPGIFDEGLEGYIVRHTTGDDDGELVMVRPATLDEVDGGQAHRIVEALRAYVGRKFAEARIHPRTFEIPPSVRRRSKATRQQGAEAPRDRSLSLKPQASPLTPQDSGLRTPPPDHPAA